MTNGFEWLVCCKNGSLIPVKNLEKHTSKTGNINIVGNHEKREPWKENKRKNEEKLRNREKERTDQGNRKKN